MDALLNDLNDEQRRAVTYGDGPLLIVAGAGTGKTTVITRRIAWLIQEGRCKPEEILALTFTDKAATEMEERVDRLLPYGYVNLWISTFHSFCERILKGHALEIGLPNDFTLLDTTATWMLVRKNLDRFNLEYYRPLANPAKFIHALLKHFSRCKDEGVTPDRYYEYAQKLRLDADSATGSDSSEYGRIEELANAYRVYQQLLLEQDAMDFGDLIVSTLRLFRERPHILERTRNAFRSLLVDEFQDTNSSQYELIKLLAAPKNNMTIVCDDDQAIFRWRGASFENILSFKKDFPESREVILTQNYRSPQNILDRAYEVIQLNNPNRLEHRLREQGGSLSKKLVSSDPLPGVLEHIHCATLDDEVAAVVNKIIKLKESSDRPGGGWGDFAILVRSNDAADPFVSACAQARIPHRFLAQKGLYAKSIIIDLISYFAVLQNAHDSPALYRVLTWPLWNVSHAMLVELTHAAHKKGCSLWKMCVDGDLLPDIEVADREQIRGIVGTLQRHGSVSRSAQLPLLFLSILKDTGLLASLGSGETAETRANLQHINEFFSKIKSFQESFPAGRLSDFMTQLSYEQESGDEGALSNSGEYDPDSVTILTIHGSKGLEFPYVFLVNMVDQRFPTRERGDGIPLPDALVSAPESASEQPHLEEERRLLYVALTRAQRGVYFFSAEHYGGSRKRKRSQFLSELGFETPVVNGQGGLAIDRSNGQSGLAVDRIAPRLPLPSSFSFTQLAAFRTCPLQYKFAFLLRIPVFGKPMLSFGKSIHATLQKFGEHVLERSKKIQQDLFGKPGAEYTENGKSLPSREELMSFFESSWIDEWYPSRSIHDEYREKGKKALDAFYEDFSTKKPALKAVERDFTIKIAAPDGLTPIRGRIDRLDEDPEGGVEIVDYKTGKSKDPNKLAFADKEQLLLYQIAAEDIGETVSQLTYHYLEDGSRISFLGSAQEKDRLKGSISETLEELRTSEFKATPGWHCQFCDFRDICEFRK